MFDFCRGNGPVSSHGRDANSRSLAYSARRKGDRGVDLGDAVYFASAAELAASAEIDIFVELIGGADGVAFEAVKAALARGRTGRHRQ